MQIFEDKENTMIKDEPNKINEGPIFGIVGIMNIIGQNYLCVIKDA